MMLSKSDLILPDWPAPPNVHAIQTTRMGGFSEGSYHSLNLGDHVGDDPLIVAANRQLLTPFVPTEPVWMRQVHGTRVIDIGTASCLPEADAAFTSASATVCCVMTADCLPILLCDRAGSVVAAVHAGWRGLLNGVIEATIAAMKVAPMELIAWLGPAIGPKTFEVGNDVQTAFTQYDVNARDAFVTLENGKWLADIYLLARQRLQAIGVTQIHGGDFCTYSDVTRFFSYRRDQTTGRMATLIWLTKNNAAGR
jgi:polyphenol oxidase